MEKKNRKDTVVFLQPDGTYDSSWGNELAGHAHGLEFFHDDGKEFLLITHQKKGLFKYDLKGQCIWHFPKPSLYKQNFFLNWGPSNVAVAPDQRIFLSDGYGIGFITVISPDGKELGMFGGPGQDNHHLMHPHGLGIDTRDGEAKLVVCDNLNPGLHYLTLDGQHIDKNLSGMRDPRHIRWDGEVMIVPDLCGCVTLLDKNNKVIGHLGDAKKDLNELMKDRENQPEALPKGHFIHPHDAIALSNGNFLVAEWVTHGRLNLLKRS